MKVFTVLVGLGLTVSVFAGHHESDSLSGILESQPDEVKARYEYRHPKETLGFFGIEKGMTVVEALPGGGWYSKILIPYLGADGQLIGVDYAQTMWPLFGFFSEERIEESKTWVADWTNEASEWSEEGAAVSAFKFGSMPAEMKGTADAVLFIRALHNLNRFESQGEYLSTALREAYEILKPGGIVGVVQHEASTERTDAFADGSKGYLKRDQLISKMEAAGFEFAGAGEFNQNPADQPGEEDMVWRLPPTNYGSEEGSEERAAMTAIGESNRMTLKFVKP